MAEITLGIHLILCAVVQARLTTQGLQNFPFKACFSSPISRAQQCAEIMWNDREEPITYLPDLSEAYLGWLQGMKNDYAAEHYAEVYGTLLDSGFAFID